MQNPILLRESFSRYSRCILPRSRSGGNPWLAMGRHDAWDGSLCCQSVTSAPGGESVVSLRRESAQDLRKRSLRITPQSAVMAGDRLADPRRYAGERLGDSPWGAEL
jgi:hypothetical protein